MRAFERWVIVILFFFIANALHAHDFLILNNATTREEAMGDKISVYEDTLGQLSFDRICKMKFPVTTKILANTRNSATAHWLRFDLEIEEDLSEKMLFEILDFKIDSFELYLPLSNGAYSKFIGGDAFGFGQRNYSHKNFLFDMPSLKKGHYYGFIRIKAVEVVGLNFAISNQKNFHHYSLNEYFILSLFYGVVVALAVISLFLYVYLKELSYLFYSFYILSLALYFLTRDGLGFQYLWADFPIFNNYCKPITVFMVLFFHVFFVKFYLNIKVNSRLVNSAIYVLLFSFPVFAYFADSVLEVLPDPLIAVTFPFFVLLIFSIKIAAKGNIEARFFVVAYIVQFLSFLIITLAYFSIINPSALVFYSLNIASAIEIIVFSLALSGKVKKLLRETAEMKDSANRILEEKVIARTKELTESNNQLDFFVYKASHDIKGPLKSMIGLASLAKLDVKDSKANEYFDYILDTSKRLDNMVEDLLRLGRVKDLKIKETEVYVHETILTIIDSFKHLSNFGKIRINVNVPETLVFKTDETLLYSVFQNIIENAIKYLDDKKSDSFLTVNYSDDYNCRIFKFEDNGLGIPSDSKDKIFNMFYKVNERSTGTGLGLYLTKLTVEKLGGSIDLLSEENVGTVFIIQFDK